MLQDSRATVAIVRLSFEAGADDLRIFELRASAASGTNGSMGKRATVSRIGRPTEADGAVRRDRPMPGP